MNSPKTRYLQTPRNQIATFLASKEFEDAADAATLQLVEGLAMAQSTEQAIARNHMIEGANLYKHTLARIAIADPEVQREQIGVLKDPA